MNGHQTFTMFCEEQADKHSGLTHTAPFDVNSSLNEGREEHRATLAGPCGGTSYSSLKQEKGTATEGDISQQLNRTSGQSAFAGFCCEGALAAGSDTVMADLAVNAAGLTGVLGHCARFAELCGSGCTGGPRTLMQPGGKWHHNRSKQFTHILFATAGAVWV